MSRFLGHADAQTSGFDASNDTGTDNNINSVVNQADVAQDIDTVDRNSATAALDTVNFDQIVDFGTTDMLDAISMSQPSNSLCKDLNENDLENLGPSSPDSVDAAFVPDALSPLPSSIENVSTQENDTPSKNYQDQGDTDLPNYESHESREERSGSSHDRIENHSWLSEARDFGADILDITDGLSSYFLNVEGGPEVDVTSSAAEISHIYGADSNTVTTELSALDNVVQDVSPADVFDASNIADASPGRSFTQITVGLDPTDLDEYLIGLGEFEYPDSRPSDFDPDVDYLSQIGIGIESPISDDDASHIDAIWDNSDLEDSTTVGFGGSSSDANWWRSDFTDTRSSSPDQQDSRSIDTGCYFDYSRPETVDLQAYQLTLEDRDNNVGSGTPREDGQISYQDPYPAGDPGNPSPSHQDDNNYYGTNAADFGLYGSIEDSTNLTACDRNDRTYLNYNLGDLGGVWWNIGDLWGDAGERWGSYGNSGVIWMETMAILTRGRTGQTQAWETLGAFLACKEI